MMNFSLHGFVWGQKLLQQEIGEAMQKAIGDAHLIVIPEDRARIEANIRSLADTCHKMLLPSADNRLGRFWADFNRQNVTYTTVVSLLNALEEAVEDDIRTEYFYHYPRQKFLQMLRVPGDWAPALKAFPLIQKDIEAGLDCFAVGYNLPCVFYLMRIMEIGVQRFGKKLGASLTARTATKLNDLTWHQILDALNPKLRGLPQRTLAQKARHEKYSAIQSYLYAVKDAWRNPTMHPRKMGYTETEAQNIINQCRSFMNELGEVVSPGQSS